MSSLNRTWRRLKEGEEGRREGGREGGREGDMHLLGDDAHLIQNLLEGGL